MEITAIHLERTDDVASVLEKLGWAQSNRIAIVFPDRGTPVENKIQLLRLVRRAEELGGTIALVTQSARLKDWANDLDIPVFKTLDTASSSYWRHTRRKRIARQESDAVKKTGSITDRVIPRYRREQYRISRWLITLLGSGLLISFALFLVPAAEISLSTDTIQQSLIIDIRSNPDIREPNISGGLPVETHSLPLIAEVNGTSSGTTKIAESRASGYVQFQNLTDGPVDVPEGTVVLSSQNPQVKYVTTDSLALPKKDGKEYPVGIIAISPGLTGNADAGVINAIEGSIGLSIIVRNAEPITGGDDKEAPSPTENDYLSKREELLADLLQNAKDEFGNRISPNRNLVPDLILIENVTEERYPEVGQPSDTYRLVIQVDFTAYSYEEDDLTSVAIMSMDANLIEGYGPVEEKLQLTPVTEAVLEGETAVWQIYATRDTHKQIDTTQIARRISGMQIGEAADIIRESYELMETPRIKVFPSWWTRIPLLDSRVRWKIN